MEKGGRLFKEVKVGQVLQNSELFQKNLTHWAKDHPVEAQFISNGQSTGWTFSKTKSEKLNLKKEGTDLFFYSTNDPEKEASEWFSSVSNSGISVMYVYGIGLGYSYLAAKKWLEEDLNHFIVYIETDPELLRAFLHTDVATDLLASSQAFLHLLPKDKLHLVNFSTIVAPFFQAAFSLSEDPFYQKTQSPQFKEIVQGIHLAVNHRLSYAIEFINYGFGFFDNFFANLKHLPTSYLADRLFGKFEAIPAIICGAGASLDRNLPLLQTLKNKALIIAGGTGFNAIEEKGFFPHFGMGVDPNPPQYARLLAQGNFEVPYFYSNRLFSLSFDLIHGEHIYLHGSQGYDIADWLENSLNIESKRILPQGFNVVTSGVALAEALGCNPIVCVGVDLAYTNDKSYSASVKNHPIHDWISDFTTKTEDDRLVERTDLFGNPVKTLWKWVQESLWYEPFVRGAKDLVFVNATEGGIGFPGIPNMTLEQVNEVFLTRDFDFDTLIHGSIQNGKMPKGVTVEKVKELLHTLKESLIKCQGVCQTIANEMGKSFQELIRTQDPDGGAFSQKIIDELKILDKEVAFTALLSAFSQAYLKIKESELPSEDQEETEPLLARSKKLDFNIQRYLFLADIAGRNAQKIEMITNQWKDPSAVERLPPKVQPFFSGYSWDQKVLIMEDAELNLHYKKRLSLRREGKTYQDGSVMLERYSLDGIVQGPMTFYSEEGRKLVSVWYLDGKKEGRGYFYYASGALHSIKRYKAGVAEGLQEFFYEDGSIKSTYTLEKGRYEGEVHLFYPGGKKKRECFFLKGELHGRESLWNEEGQLIIEAFYENGNPAKSARSWYWNGQLAKEVAYDEKGNLKGIMRWDHLGNFVSHQRKMVDDFFDQVTEQSSYFADSLESLYHQVNLMAAMMTKKEDQGALTTELSKIEENLQQLKKLSATMMEQTGLSLNVAEEPLWKNPDEKRQIQELLGKMTQTLYQEMKHLQKYFMKTSDGSPPSE